MSHKRGNKTNATDVPFSLSCFSLVAISLQIQTSDRQRLSMFWSPEWIFPVHPSVRLFSEVRGGVRGRVCVWARVVGWVGARDQTQYISHRRPNILIVWCTIWSTVPVISISRAHPGTAQPRLSHLVQIRRPFCSSPMQPCLSIPCFLSVSLLQTQPMHLLNPLSTPFILICLLFPLIFPSHRRTLDTCRVNQASSHLLQL